MERIARHKHSSFLRMPVSYGRKMFYRIGPWSWMSSSISTLGPSIFILGLLFMQKTSMSAAPTFRQPDTLSDGGRTTNSLRHIYISDFIYKRNCLEVTINWWLILFKKMFLMLVNNVSKNSKALWILNLCLFFLLLQCLLIHWRFCDFSLIKS